MNNLENLIAIRGNTFPVKEELKKLGARWNADEKAWMIAPEKMEEANRIVAKAGPRKPFAGAARSYGARSGGGRFYGRNRDDDCELCGKNRYKCGHCIGW